MLMHGHKVKNLNRRIETLEHCVNKLSTLLYCTLKIQKEPQAVSDNELSDINEFYQELKKILNNPNIKNTEEN